MIVTLAALACLGFYLANVPLKCALVWRSRPQPELRGGASIFEGRFALRRALRKKKDRRPPSLSILRNPGLLRPLLRAAGCLLRHAQLEYISLQGIISPPDAAATALVTGLGNLLHNACLPFGHLIQIRLQPDFSASGSDVEFVGMISLRSGHIILTALIFAFDYSKVRFKEWKAGTRLRALCTRPLKTSAT